MTNAKQIKSYLSLSDYEKIMEALSIPIYKKEKTQWIFWTGDKNKNPLNGSPKLYFYTDTKIFFGYTAGRSYDIFSLVQTRLGLLNKNCKFIDALNFITKIVGIDNSFYINTPTIKTYDWENDIGKYIKYKRKDYVLKNFDINILSQFQTKYPEEWIDEGISKESMEKFKIKYYPRLQATVIPCQDKNGNLIGIRCRHWLPEEIKNGKYRPLYLLNNKSFEFPTNQVFYGINYNWAEIERTGHVILVEGEKSVLKADTWWREKSNVLGLYGSNVGLNRVKQLLELGVNHVTLALDSDFEKIDDDNYKIFVNKILNIGKLFKGFCLVDVVFNNIELNNWNKNSPFDGDEEVWQKMWNNRTIIY